jgi:ribonuclease D
VSRVSLFERYCIYFYLINDFTCLLAVSFTVVEDMRSMLAHGSGANGFTKSLRERYKQSHAAKAKMWRSHVALEYSAEGMANVKKRTPHFDFDDPRNDIELPSLSYLLAVAIADIESRIPFYTRKLQMQGGQHLSADHSHKYAKVVLTKGVRAYDGIYTVMNEFGKILGFYFVNGTSMREIEKALRGINQRYKHHGFKKISLFTTDNCCNERDFMTGNNNAGKSPVFPTLARETGAEVEVNPLNDNVQEEQFTQKKYVTVPLDPIRPASRDSAREVINGIIVKCQDNGWDTIGFDSEWVIGTKTGPAVITLATPDGATYYFSEKVFNNSLWNLLGSDQIKKVANRISADISKLKEIGKEVNGVVELGHEAANRGIVKRRNPALEDLVPLLFHCFINKDPKLRISNWSTKDPSNTQVEYAVVDAYAHLQCHLKLMTMPYVDPEDVPPPGSMTDLAVGDAVFLYASNKKNVVATGTFMGQAKKVNMFGTEANVKGYAKIQVMEEDLRIPGALVKVPTNSDEDKAFSVLFDEAKEKEGSILVPWKLSRVRLFETIPPQPNEPVIITTKLISVPVPQVEPDEVDEESIRKAAETEGVTIESEACDDESKGLKQDVEHIFIRFGKWLSKSHGAFGVFMARLSDAFFVPSQDDIEFIKAALRKADVSEDDINSKKWQYYKTRVRRTVPGPVELEREFKKVVQLFADVPDAKTSKPLFSKAAWNLYKSTLKHIRKGCLSDVAGMSYYVELRTDSMGIPIFKCLRGTNALEGFHQKIRQVIRGFNVSPRYAVALLHEFVYRWNHDVDVRVMGLPKKYSNYYDGWVIEDEIEETLSWEELESTVHHDWETTRDYANTGEVFGITDQQPISLGNQVPQTEAETDKDLDAEVAKLVDYLNDGTLEEEEEEAKDSPCNVAISNQVLAESAAWAGKTLRQSRETGPVTTESEKRFFADNHIQYLKTADDTEADNYSSFAWDRFSIFWNGIIAEEEAGRRPKSNMRLKSAFHLQAYCKKYKKEANARATLLNIHSAEKNMRRDYRGVTRQTDVSTPDALMIRHVMSHSLKRISTGALLEEQAAASVPQAVATYRVEVPLFPSQRKRSNKVSSGEEAEPPKKKREPRRCRNCGNTYEPGSNFRDYHVVAQGKIGSSEYKDPQEACTTPSNLRVEGFPLEKGERMPRKRGPPPGGGQWN